VRGTDIVPLRSVHSVGEAADAMLDHVTTITHPLRIGVGGADAAPSSTGSPHGCGPPGPTRR